MRPMVAILRILAAGLGLAATTVSYLTELSEGPVNPFNYFGFFTIQSNILLFVALFAAAFIALAGRRQPHWLMYLRAIATTAMIIVGLVYNTLLAGLYGFTADSWTNPVHHIVLPIYAVLDWLFFGDRIRLPWKRLWVPLLYPIVWLLVVLVRGATDGWVPYPFLEPGIGYGSVALFCGGITLAFVGAATIVWWMSRIRIVKVR